jgi:hypothetical protein
MEATYTAAHVVDTPLAGARYWEAAKAAVRVLGRTLADSARGERFDRAFTTSPDAQFAALPTSQQNRLLDRGYRF